jgi:hypothetical protein
MRISMGWMCVQAPPLPLEQAGVEEEAPINGAKNTDETKGGDDSRLLISENTGEADLL